MITQTIDIGTPDPLKALQVLEARATPAPWSWWTSNSMKRITCEADPQRRQDGDVLRATMHSTWPDLAISKADMELIVALRNAAPALLALAGQSQQAASQEEDEKLSQNIEIILKEQEGLNHPATQVFFRAGLLACREYMARFVAATNPEIAAAIRAKWFPEIGEDFGPPRTLEWSELTEGEYGQENFRVREPQEISPTLEALPIALTILNNMTEGENG
jgi:hypothetical protein